MKVTRVLNTVVLGGIALTAAGALWMTQVTDSGPVGRAEAQQQQDIEFIDNGRLLSGAVRVGRTLYQAIIRGEGPTVVSFVTVMVLIYLVINLLVDLLYAVLDPRIRYAK